MNNRAEVREFLLTRRAKITPEQAGIPTAGHRRVPGLRRSEVATLAGVSVEYYAKLERGSLAGVSAGVLDAIARALELDDAERAHLVRLAQEANGSTAVSRPTRRPRTWTVRPGLQWSLDAITSPAILANSRQDFARFTFLDSAAHRFFPDWELAADMLVANLRTAAGKDAHDKGLQDLVGELSTRSVDFRRRWAAHDVRVHGTGTKSFRHHSVGDLQLAYESMDLRAEPDLTLTIYAAEPDSPTAQALTLLASWAATANHAALSTPNR